MEITVISEEENPMLHRTDVRFRVSHAEATPDRLAVRDSLAARLNKDADEVVIRKLDTKFGMRETLGEAKVYQGAEFAQDVEQAYMLARNKIGAAAEVEADEEDAEAGEEADTGEETAAEAQTEAEPEVEPEKAEAEPAAKDEAEEEDTADAGEDEADGSDDVEGAEGTDDEEEAAGDDAEETEE